MDLYGLDSPPPSATFGQDASFKLDQPTGATSISPSGRDVVLASKEGLHIIDLDSPFSPPRHLPHRTPWEVADVQWSPFAIRDYWIVSTSNQKALVWNVGIAGWRDAIEFVLHGHTRAITDINFSAHHPDILATCAVDSFVHGWDLRTPARPVFSFSDWFAGATQVKWSRQDEHAMASSHDRFLHIWDKRKGAHPARTIEAHGTKIYGVDWNRFEPTKIVTCSLDKTVKFWDIGNDADTPERVIETPFPVWRARHTPFGWGLLAMPQRGNNELHLYDRRPVNGKLSSGAIQPAATFPGHKGQVKEFLWRARGTIRDGVDHRDFQLVSWGTDGELRLHSIGKPVLEAVGYEKGVTRPVRLNFTRRNAKYKTFRDDTGDAQSPFEFGGRADSNQSHHYSFGARNRHSTNIGMSKIHMAQFRGWLHAGKQERRTGMHGKSTVRRDMNPIAWMKNVKITSWDPDSLADEITQVGERFRKIEFESVDIGQRKAVMSLQGSWGENGISVYTRAELYFPRAYPRDAAATVTIFKSNSIDEEVYKILSTEVYTIADTYASKQRGCIEAIVRYLLHEQSLEQIVSYLLGEEIADPKDLAGAEVPADLSSDSDDDNLDGQQDPSSSSANLRMPIPKGCGALWSNTGELVCFFPQKSKEPMVMTSKIGANNFAEHQSNRLFDGFGRLQTSSPARRSGNGTQPTIDEAGSDISDFSSTFSSSSSSTSSSGSDGGLRGFATYASAMNMGMRQRSRSADRSNKSTTMDGTKLGEESRRTTISINHDVKDLIPSQKMLAEQYRIFGPGPAVCEHNASVAERAFLPDTASVWRLASFILQQRVPSTMTKSSNSLKKGMAFVNRQRTSRLQRKDSTIELGGESCASTTDFGPVRWGNNPLGAKYLITAIFNYFEKKADVQMLATLSCVLALPQRQSGMHATRPTNKRPLVLHTGYRPLQETVELPSHHKHASSEGFMLAVTRPDAAEKLEDSSITRSLRDPHLRPRYKMPTAAHPSSHRTDDVSSRATNATAYSNSGAATSAKTSTISTSASPEESRFSHRANSGAAFAASRASLNALAQSFQNSPPSNSSTAGSSLKKFSPSTSGWAGSLFGSAHNSRASRASQAPSEANSDEAPSSNIRESKSMANLQDLRRAGHRRRDNRGGPKSQETATNADTTNEKVKKHSIKTSLHNQSQFDLEGHSRLPLLDTDLMRKHRRYTLAYADQLGSWSLFVQQAEILQFNGDGFKSLTGRRRGAGLMHELTSKLEITRCCIECGNSFTAIEKNGIPIGWHCANVSSHFPPREKVSKNQVCSVCQTIIKGLSVPCLQCGHITCYSCAETWFGQSVHDAYTFDVALQPQQPDLMHDLNPCPTGCGCPCPALQSLSGPDPPDLGEDKGLAIRQEPIDSVPDQATRRHSRVAQQQQRPPNRNKLEARSGPDTVLGAVIALSRSRTASVATTKTAVTAGSDSHSRSHSHGHGHATRHPNDGLNGNSSSGADMRSTLDDLVPWSNSKLASLGRGIGGGLSRGLSNRSSDATIRER